MRHIGYYGETLAKHHLKQHGFIIVATNVYTRYGELDIIARKKNRVHVIEVKFLKKARIHSGYKINRVKKIRMIRSSQIAIDRYSLHNTYIQFDLITIVTGTIHHIENIFNVSDV